MSFTKRKIPFKQRINCLFGFHPYITHHRTYSSFRMCPFCAKLKDVRKHSARFTKFHWWL
jgi:hypothetical protein